MPSREADGSVVAPISLDWPISRRFLRYVANVPDGRCSFTDGATASGGGGFAFELDRVDAGADGSARLLWFRGDVRFSAHHGLLFVRIADPCVDLSAEHPCVTVLGDERLGLGRFVFGTAESVARVDDAGDRLRAPCRSSELVLSEAGAQVFGEVYPAGMRLDGFVIAPGATRPMDDGEGTR